MHLKHIPMDGPQNFRDLGGYLNKDGLMSAWNRLYRADGLNGLSEKDADRFKALNIRTIVDLRGSFEQQAMPDIVPEGVTYCSCPLMKEEISGEKTLKQNTFVQSLVVGYRTMINEGQELIGAAASAVMEGLEKGAVVFHCTAGKDRTGILAAVLLLALGMEEEDIIADYQVSHTYNAKGVNRMLDESPEVKAFVEAAGEDSMMHSHPKNIQAVLELLNSGNISDWLEEAGVPLKLQRRFREMMLEN